ncbi:hypothetical protein [Cognatiyoonia sp. IB215182]|uniref:hypothetical protein n=1 Tax=Cognatiyoonia sp. IB215182 TaxID=3097353 RepID=UPI002A0C44AD|nr:hypothetical protein [Cognatiyoonia sp. IB215182]MDX8353376.1 hypothetical protein [Cognatiyoonia sp. IB215182]
MTEAVVFLAARLTGLLILPVIFLLIKLLYPVLLPLRDLIMLNDDANMRVGRKNKR